MAVGIWTTLTSFCCLLAAATAAAGSWGEPVEIFRKRPYEIKSVACNEGGADSEGHGVVCLGFGCTEGQYRFVIVAGSPLLGPTNFSSGAHSVTLELLLEDPGNHDSGWNVSRALVDFAFLARISRESDLTFQCIQCKKVTLPLENFAAELDRVRKSCG